MYRRLGFKGGHVRVASLALGVCSGWGSGALPGS